MDAHSLDTDACGVSRCLPRTERGFPEDGGLSSRPPGRRLRRQQLERQRGRLVLGARKGLSLKSRARRCAPAATPDPLLRRRPSQ
ncbi:hypothetical protein AAFF_G00320300 [Aldrovandia affinis]|uniref:Uncharacterized protein n=1 Tax=Aldrovandia affinis TaxID=143900 RepID=A0AAD7R796_9TELE|nr:hypothetical protein AAFF_G00320300 [Aldrovandia affinis]